MNGSGVMYYLSYIQCPRCSEELEGSGHSTQEADHDARSRYFDHLRGHGIGVLAAGMMMILAGISRTDEVPEI